MKNAFRAVFQMTLMAVLLLATLAAMTSCKDKFKTDADVYSNKYVVTLSADGIDSFGNYYYATLHGLFTEAVEMDELPGEDFGFEFGEDRNLSGEVKVIESEYAEGEGGRGFRAMVDDLLPSTTYYFRAFVKVNGNIERGAIVSFATDVLHPKSVDIYPSSVTLTFGETETAELTATVNPPNASNQEVDWRTSNDKVVMVNPDGVITAMGKGNAKIYVTTRDGGKTGQCEVEVKAKPHAAVDLGLSVKWADINIGAAHEGDTGSYYQWGYTYQTTNASETGYKYYYNSSTSTPDYLYGSSQDAAWKEWGSDWRMPTSDQLNELLNQCTWTLDKVRGCDGFRVSRNGKSIFLPFAGCLIDKTVYSVGVRGYYWTATRGQGPDANYYHYVKPRCLKISSDGNKDETIEYGYNGYTIRPVMP